MKEYKFNDDEVIALVDDEILGFQKTKLGNNPKIRYASRGIVFNSENKIALLNKKGKNEYKLPGGGINLSEDIRQAFVREVLEETGCKIGINDYLGVAIEEKGLTNFKQVSFVFVGEVIVDTKKLRLTKKERDEGAEVVWVSLDKAIELITKCSSFLIGSKYDDLYRSLFMIKRDSMILSYYKNNVKTKNR